MTNTDAPTVSVLRSMIRLRLLLEIVPLSRSTIYERMAAGTFPKSRDLGGGVVAWYVDEIQEWLACCPASGSEPAK